MAESRDSALGDRGYSALVALRMPTVLGKEIMLTHKETQAILRKAKCFHDIHYECKDGP